MNIPNRGGALHAANEVNKSAQTVEQPERLLTTDEVAAMLQVKRSTLECWRQTGRQAIPFVRVGACVRYRLSAVLAYLDQNTSGGAISE